MTMTSFIYPKHNGPHHHSKKETKSQKKMDIDASVYHLLSLYLSKDALTNNTLVSSRRPNKNYCKQALHRAFRPQRSWLGEETKAEHDLVLERNTISNAFIQVAQSAKENALTKKRTKAVSFSNTVTVVLSQDNVSTRRLKNEEEECFVDALEYIV
ncbi:hypothetical protein A0J61_04897 [Choanephora cucurbitarum]|uniref:Uncharacterized protein n=1 Tax=Choanephora cucurbitarum TaxID=101091 RepID=A0A1C7NE61_9FUNG|nr:hypothetical protein A0J61_04897 [Choanephora cucurbitarum]